MGEKELFNFGGKELNVNSLLNNINSNQQSYLDYYSTSILDSNAFIEKVNYIKEGIKNGNITTDGTGVYYDANGKLSKDDELMNNALHYVDIIAKEQSKKTRALTQSERTKQEEDKKLKQAELERQKAEQETIQKNTKPDFNPPEGWSVAASFAHSFNQNGQIPYDLLQQLVTTDAEGNSVYTDLHTQLDKNFDSISKQLESFNGTESYINNINLFKQALKDGDLSPQDRFLGMELGFQNSELDKLNALLKYKLQPVVEEVVEEPKQEPKLEVPELKQNPLERDDFYQERVNKYNQEIQKLKNDAEKVVSIVKFNQFESPKTIKEDSEDEFRRYLINYINNALLKSQNSEFVKIKYQRGLGEYYETPILIKKFTENQLQYIDPKLYNELGLKFFSKYSTTKMYKHFKDLVDKQNKEATKHEKGGILKAENGLKTPWRLNFDGTIHQMDDIYKLFIENIQSYDSKQMAEALNKLNSDEYKSLNFRDNDNTLGFKNWNTTFNDSGLNNLFGYNEGKSDYLGVTTKSRHGFIDHLKTQGTIKTGNGSLSWNPESNQWEYNDWVDKNPTTSPETKTTETQPTGSQSNVKAPEAAGLSLKELDIRKPVDLNPDGVVNSVIGYAANEFANNKKHEIQEKIPIHLEQAAPEKAFRTAYTYDLEKEKGEILAEATSIQPMTSDVNDYYTARNEAIKNARAYTSKIDTQINNIVHQTADENQDINYANAVSRHTTAKTNAENIHNWKVEQLQGDVDLTEARNQSFQNLNKEIKHSVVTAARKRQKQRDAYVSKYILTGLTTNPSNYIDGWTRHHDLIWSKGQNGTLETNQEQIEYQQLLSIVNQASSNIFAQYENIKYPGIGTLHNHTVLTEAYDPSKHGVAVVGAKGMKINKNKIGNFINKLK